MQAQTSPIPIKLNPTTITIPSSATTYPVLKLALTPHLIIQHSPLSEPSSIKRDLKKDSDAAFEVTVPVGGVVEVEVDIDRDALEKIGGEEMTIMHEMELEEVIKKKVLATFTTNRNVLSLQDVRPGQTDSCFSLRPIAASADRSAALADIIPSYQPIAHLAKLAISLNWSFPVKRFKTDLEAPLPESQEEDMELDQRMPQFVKGVQADRLVQDGIPAWAVIQLSSALGQLVRSHLIKRFPLIFDPALPTYLPSITVSSNLIGTITRVLALSSTHRTELLWNARRSLEGLVEQRSKIASYKSTQVRGLGKRTNGRKRIKSDSQSESQGCEDPALQPATALGVTIDDDEGLEPMVETADASTSSISPDLLKDAITQIGWTEWKKKRCGNGRISCWRIELSTEASEASTERPPLKMSAKQLDARMRNLYIGDEGRWDAFFDGDDPDIADEGAVGLPRQVSSVYDHMFIDTEDGLDDIEDEDHDDLLDHESGHDLGYLFNEDQYDSDDGIEDYFLATDNEEEEDSLNCIVDARMDHPDRSDLFGLRHPHEGDRAMSLSYEWFDCPDVPHDASVALPAEQPADDAEVFALNTAETYMKDAFLSEHDYPDPDDDGNMSNHADDIDLDTESFPRPLPIPVNVVDAPSPVDQIPQSSSIDIDYALLLNIDLEHDSGEDLEEEGMYSGDERFFGTDEDEDMSLTPPSTPYSRLQSDRPLDVFQNGWFGDDWFNDEPKEQTHLGMGEGGQEMEHERIKTPTMVLDCEDEFMSDEEEDEDGMSISQHSRPQGLRGQPMNGPRTADKSTMAEETNQDMGMFMIVSPQNLDGKSHPPQALEIPDSRLFPQAEDLHDYNDDEDGDLF